MGMSFGSFVQLWETDASRPHRFFSYVSYAPNNMDFMLLDNLFGALPYIKVG